MSDGALRILQVSPSDRAGGAERAARNLFAAYRNRGHRSWLAVGHRHGDTDDPDIFTIPDHAARNAWVRWCQRQVERQDAAATRLPGAGRVWRWLRAAGEPGRALARAMGREDFQHPGSTRVLSLTPERADIVHLHNLHGGYFDLRVLPALSARVPTVLNLHDAWLLSGHCAFPLGCERWKTGCGQCPDLDIYPAVPRDATAFNWRRKRALFARSRVFVTAPSRWLLEQVSTSILAPAVVASRVIGNGVDTRVFCPGDRAAARDALGIEADAKVILTAANGLRDNVFKDYRTLKEAIARLGEGWRGPSPVVLAVGEAAADEQVGALRIRFVPYQDDPRILARHYRAADVYVHAARVESFGTTLLEARACGTPVVSTAVGGIPEHVQGLACAPATDAAPTFGRDRATGIVVAAGDPQAMADALSLLLADDALCRALGANAAKDVATNWSLDRQADRFLDWYRVILAGDGAQS